MVLTGLMEVTLKTVNLCSTHGGSGKTFWDVPLETSIASRIWRRAAAEVAGRMV